VKTGLFLIIPLFFIIACSSCQKGIDALDEPTIIDSTNKDSSITDTTYFIDITLNGKRIFQISSTVKGWSFGNPWYILGDTSIYPYSSLKSEFDSSGEPSFFGLYFSKNEYALNMSTYVSNYNWWTPLMNETFIDSFFKAGDYSYAILTGRDTSYTISPVPDSGWPRTLHLLGTGIHLIWFDETGKAWETCNGTADQSGSYFTITKNKSTPYTFNTDYPGSAQSTDVTASFACNLYDESGNVIHLTNGKFRMQVKFRQFN